MPRWVFPIVILSLIILAVEIYAAQAIKTITKKKFILLGWFVFSVFSYANFFY